MNVCALLLAMTALAAEPPRYDSENDELWASYAGAPLEDVLRELAEAAGLELWLEGSLQGTVTVELEGVSLKDGVEAIFEDGSANHALFFDEDEPTRLTKIYASDGSAGSGRMSREPTVAAPKPPPRE